MKKIILIAFISSMLVAADLSAETVYVSSLKTDLYSNTKRSSKKITSMKRGSRLVVLSKKGSWIKVRFRNRQGWVQKLFTSTIRPGKKVSLLGRAGNNARVHARKRASSDVTAASARGLLADNKSASGRARQGDLKSSGFDEADFDKMNKLFIPEVELVRFLSEGGLK